MNTQLKQQQYEDNLKTLTDKLVHMIQVDNTQSTKKSVILMEVTIEALHALGYCLPPTWELFKYFDTEKLWKSPEWRELCLEQLTNLDEGVSSEIVLRKG